MCRKEMSVVHTPSLSLPFSSPSVSDTEKEKKKREKKKPVTFICLRNVATAGMWHLERWRFGDVGNEGEDKRVERDALKCPTGTVVTQRTSRFIKIQFPDLWKLQSPRPKDAAWWFEEFGELHWEHQTLLPTWRLAKHAHAPSHRGYFSSLNIVCFRVKRASNWYSMTWDQSAIAK